jgi:hypothetical protein
LTFKSVQLTDHVMGKTTVHFVNTDKDVDEQAGKWVGNDEFEGFLELSGQVHGTIAFALKAGFIYAVFTSNGVDAVHGHLTGGTGKYRGVAGTLRGTSNPQGDGDTARFTITYHS